MTTLRRIVWKALEWGFTITALPFVPFFYVLMFLGDASQFCRDRSRAARDALTSATGSGAA